MLFNAALCLLGEVLVLLGIVQWSAPLALVLAGAQLLAIGLLRAEGDAPARRSLRDWLRRRKSNT